MLTIKSNDPKSQILKNVLLKNRTSRKLSDTTVADVIDTKSTTVVFKRDIKLFLKKTSILGDP